MSGIRDRFEDVLDQIKAEIEKLLGHADPEVTAVAEKVTAAVGELRGDVPAVEAEVKADAVKVATDAVAAEAPVAKEAAEDGAHLVGEVKADVENATKDA